MYEPAYQVRAVNDKKTDPTTGALDPHFQRKIMEASARLHNYDLKFVGSKAEMLQEMAKATAINPMKNGGYFGHSSPQKLLLDYGQNPPPPGSAEDVAHQTIGADDFRNAGVRFHPDAHFASYGCRQGEPGGMMEKLSRDHNIKTTGSVGKTSYKAIGQSLAIPYSANGYTSFKNGAPIPPLVVSPTPPPPKP